MPNTIYVNVDGTWKTASNYYVNVDGTWKTGTEFQINVASSWKGGIAVSSGLPTTAEVGSLDYIDWTLPVLGNLDAKTAVNSFSMDILDWTLPVVGKAYST